MKWWRKIEYVTYLLLILSKHDGTRELPPNRMKKQDVPNERGFPGGKHVWQWHHITIFGNCAWLHFAIDSIHSLISPLIPIIHWFPQWFCHWFQSFIDFANDFAIDSNHSLISPMISPLIPIIHWFPQWFRHWFQSFIDFPNDLAMDSNYSLISPMILPLIPIIHWCRQWFHKRF